MTRYSDSKNRHAHLTPKDERKREVMSVRMATIRHHIELLHRGTKDTGLWSEFKKELVLYIKSL